MIVALVPRIGGSLTLYVALDRYNVRDMKDNHVLRQELADRMQDAVASGAIDELVVLYRETPEELREVMGKFVGPITAQGEPTK